MAADPRIAFFDNLAKTWDGEEPGAQTMIERLGALGERLGLSAGMELLEVGCGTGKLTVWLADRVAPGRVTAIDFAPQMVCQAKKKHIDADFQCVDVCSDAVGEGIYDVVLCFHSFPHFRDPAAASRNFARSLKVGGRLIVMHLAGSEHINGFHANIDGPVRGDMLPQAEKWDELLTQAGLKLIELVDREDLFFLQAVRE